MHSNVQVEQRRLVSTFNRRRYRARLGEGASCSKRYQTLSIIVCMYRYVYAWPKARWERTQEQEKNDGNSVKLESSGLDRKVEMIDFVCICMYSMYVLYLPTYICP